MRLNNLLAAILLITVSLTQIACTDEISPREQNYLNALEYIKQNDDESAIKALKNAIRIDARFAEARYQLGLLYLEQGNPQAAFDELQKSFDIDKTNLDAGVKVAEFYLLSRDKEQSRKYVEQVLTSAPDYEDALALLANLELIEGKLDKAVETIDKAITANNAGDKLFNIKGRIMMALGNPADAEYYFRQAILLAPESFTNYRTLLMFYEHRNDADSIQTLLDEIARKFPDAPQMHVLLAGAYLKRNERDKAEKEMLLAVSKSSGNVSYRMILADFYNNLNDFAKAEKVLKQANKDFPDDIQVKTSLAEALFANQEFAEARKLMDSVLADIPDNGAANLLKARFLLDDNKDHEALEILNQFMTKTPKWADPFYYAAQAYQRLNNSELALKSVELAIQNNPANDKFHTLAAQIYLLHRKSEEAIHEASVALRINPDNGSAIIILGKAFIQGKEFEKAVKLMTQLSPEAIVNDAELLNILGMGYLGMHDQEKARQTYEKLLQLIPENGNILAIMADLSAGEDVAKAIDFVRTHLEQHKSGSNYLVLGDLLRKNKQYRDALRAYAEAQQLSPDNPQGYLKSAQLLSKLGKIEDTLQQFNTLLSQSPDSIPGLMGLAAIQETIGETEKAKANYTHVMKLAPDHPLAANNLAWLISSEENGDLGKALRLAMLAKQSMPNSANIADTLGWVHYQRKSFALAITQFEEALQNSPQNTVIQHHLSLALWEAGQKDKALAVLKEALSGASDNQEKDAMKRTLDKWEAPQTTLTEISQ